ncbi:hypothetical protein D3C78_856810 [compost metagenome]
MRLIAIAPGMQNLQGDFAALFVDRVRHYAMMRQLADIVQHRAAFHADARQRRRDAAGHNQGHAVTGTLGVKRCQPFSAIWVFFQTGMHRAH